MSKKLSSKFEMNFCNLYPTYCGSKKNVGHGDCHNVMLEYYGTNIGFICPVCRTLERCEYISWYGFHSVHLKAFNRSDNKKNILTEIRSRKAASLIIESDLDNILADQTKQLAAQKLQEEIDACKLVDLQIKQAREDLLVTPSPSLTESILPFLPTIKRKSTDFKTAPYRIKKQRSFTEKKRLVQSVISKTPRQELIVKTDARQSTPIPPLISQTEISYFAISDDDESIPAKVVVEEIVTEHLLTIQQEVQSEVKTESCQILILLTQIMSRLDSLETKQQDLDLSIKALIARKLEIIYK